MRAAQRHQREFSPQKRKYASGTKELVVFTRCAFRKKLSEKTRPSQRRVSAELLGSMVHWAWS